MPTELDGAKVLHYAVVSEDVRPTGATRHIQAGELLGPASALAIAQYSNGSDFYLFYLDAEGAVVSDTCHDTLESAFDQAGYEYEGLFWSDLGANGRLS